MKEGLFRSALFPQTGYPGAEKRLLRLFQFLGPASNFSFQTRALFILQPLFGAHHIGAHFFQVGRALLT